MCTEIKSRITMTNAAFNKTFRQQLDVYLRKKIIKVRTQPFILLNINTLDSRPEIP
jgi:hypothetical protein